MWAAARALTGLMSSPSALATSLSLRWSFLYDVPKGALPVHMSALVASVTPTLLYGLGVRSSDSDDVLTNVLG